LSPAKFNFKLSYTETAEGMVGTKSLTLRFETVFLNWVALFSTDFAKANGKENKPTNNVDMNKYAFLTFLFCIGINFRMLKNKNCPSDLLTGQLV
jgi:hypothetical protein